MLRDNEEDAAILDYCRDLEASPKALDAFREPVPVLLDISGAKAQTKRWGWVKKGAPIIVEVGPRDVAGGTFAVIRRDQLYQDRAKPKNAFLPRADFIATSKSGSHQGGE